MQPSERLELPASKERTYRKAVRFEWLTIGYLITAIIGIYLTMGSSQAMKTAWIEDMLSLIPAIGFLIASRIRNRPPSQARPYGWHRSVSIAYFVASVALLTMGALLLFDSIMKLVAFEHPSIGTVQLFGHQIWLGWLMIPAAAYSAFPAMIIGRMKLPLATELHDKVLFADAKMNKADWLTGVAAMAGVTGIAFGLWWADSVAAAVISFDILHDGWTNITAATNDLMDRIPQRVDRSGREPVPRRIQTEIERMPWVKQARVRMREEGHVFFGEVFVVPHSDADLTTNLEDAAAAARAIDWRIQDVVLMPVSSLPDLDEADAGSEEGGA